MKAQDRVENIGARISLSLGLPLGIAAMVLFAIVFVLITGESLFLLGWFFTNRYSTLGLLIAFVIILGFAGRMLAKDIYADKNKLWVTLKYSVLVNAVIWSVFLLIHLIRNKEFDIYFGLAIPLVLVTTSIILTPFTVGLWIYKAVTRKIKNDCA